MIRARFVRRTPTSPSSSLTTAVMIGKRRPERHRSGRALRTPRASAEHDNTGRLRSAGGTRRFAKSSRRPTLDQDSTRPAPPRRHRPAAGTLRARRLPAQPRGRVPCGFSLGLVHRRVVEVARHPRSALRGGAARSRRAPRRHLGALGRRVVRAHREQRLQACGQRRVLPPLPPADAPPCAADRRQLRDRRHRDLAARLRRRHGAAVQADGEAVRPDRRRLDRRLRLVVPDEHRVLRRLQRVAVPDAHAGGVLVRDAPPLGSGSAGGLLRGAHAQQRGPPRRPAAAPVRA